MLKITSKSLARCATLSALRATRPTSTVFPKLKETTASTNIQPVLFVPSSIWVSNISHRHLSMSCQLLAEAAAKTATATTPSPTPTPTPQNTAPSDAAPSVTGPTADTKSIPTDVATSDSAAKSASQMGSKDELVLDFLPEKPTPTTTGFEEYAVGVDPPLDAVGLGSWWPAGRVQVLLDYLHGSVDLHWCTSILIATVAMRLLVSPLAVIAQKNMVLLNNNSPKMQEIQNRMTEARQRGDMLESAKVGSELQSFMKTRGINPLKNMLPIMAQAPIFMAMFLGIRGMANLPLESMLTGGILWFKDLTIPDQYYLMPLFISTTTFLQFHLGADGAMMTGKSPLIKVMKYGIPVIMLAFTVNFPSAITFYWFWNNLISVTQARLIRTKPFRKRFGIPDFEINAKKASGPKKGFRESVRESVDNFRVQAEIADRRAHDEQVFREVGSAKPKRTFRFDPTRQKRL